MELVDKKEIVKKVEDFLKKNAVAYDEINIEVLVKTYNGITTTLSQRLDYYCKLKRDD